MLAFRAWGEKKIYTVLLSDRMPAVAISDLSIQGSSEKEGDSQMEGSRIKVF